MKPFHFIPLKYQDFGEEEVEFKNQKSLFKNVKNISVLNEAFSKSVLVLIKKWVYYEYIMLTYDGEGGRGTSAPYKTLPASIWQLLYNTVNPTWFQWVY